MLKSLHARHHKLAEPEKQLEFLSNGIFGHDGLPTFSKSLERVGLWPFKPLEAEVFQINLGYMCNQTCAHCHVDAGPDRKEVMSRETMEQCLSVLRAHAFHTVDLTGGAPEMNPDFRWFVEQIRQTGVQDIIVRSNLTILRANKHYFDLPYFFKENRVHVVSSLPYFLAARTDSQRGEGVFDKSIEALRMLNELGYGMEGSELKLDLVYNPAGAFLPGDQKALEDQFKKELKRRFDIHFNQLLTITNLPISRFLEYLLASGNYTDYMEKLVTAFNPSAAMGVMCRNTLSVDYRGNMYDCDFNQMLELPLVTESGNHISQFDIKALNKRNIQVGQHCYGCTAGAGSSCQGAVV
jgi:radical SAM/Cys-rich protein